jgi:hypothetical protein
MLTDTDIGKKVPISFLRDYNEFGSRSHLLAVSAIKQALTTTVDDDDKKILAVKAFGEFVSALEDLGAICIAVRHRDDGLGIVYGFLTYGTQKPFAPKTSLKKTFQLCQAGNGMVDALCLPTLEKILSSVPELSSTIAPTLYQEANTYLSHVASVFLKEDGAIIRAYNKTKHGFVVVKNRNTLQADPPQSLSDTSWIVDVNSKYDGSKPSAATVVELFAVKANVVEAIFERVVAIRGAIMTICELTATLLEQEIITSADSKA